MSADDRMLALIMNGSVMQLRILCAWLWEGLKTRLSLSGGGSYYDDLSEWVSVAERKVENAKQTQFR